MSADGYGAKHVSPSKRVAGNQTQNPANTQRKVEAMGKHDVHFSSARTGESERDVWATPQALFEALDDEFNFVVDAAANTSNFLCCCFYGPGSGMGEDALAANWADDARERDGAVWCNPPYSQLRAFVRKAREESDKGVTVVMLIPARTDTAAFHDHIFGRAEVRFLRGRLKFSNAVNGAPFPSCVVIFRPLPA